MSDENPFSLDREEFTNQTHDALSHLYELPYLMQAPLARWITTGAGTETSGRVLRRLLLDTIQDLKPPANAPAEIQATSCYEFLYMRYVCGQSIVQIARELSLTERQVYRRQRQALDAISTALLHKLDLLADGPNSRLVHHQAQRGPVTESRRYDVEAEVDRIGMTRTRIPTDLTRVIEGALVTIGSLTQSDRATISVRVAPALPLIAVDRTVIRQAILALLLFAIHVPGAPSLQAGTDPESDDVYLSLVVRGNPASGGWDQVEQDTNLAVSKRLTELQGGRFHSRVGGGTLEIILSLPIARPRKVLVVDDNADTLQLFTRYIEGSVDVVATASTGKEALEAVTHARPDVIILDVMLPSIDGWEILQSLHSHPDTIAIPVIVCTVLKHQELALALGAADFVSKPATQGALLAALDRCWSFSR